MPRIPRIVIPGVPLHITQRGVDRCPTFLTAEDFAFYRWALREAQAEAFCQVHAYVLMTNHVHLLITPWETRGPARLMRSLGRRYVRHFNDRYRRTGTLWEGRYRSALVMSVAYLFACSRYIEMNPVRAGLVATPGEYEWSSFGRNARGTDDVCVSEHPLYGALGASADARRAAYAAMFAQPVESEVVATLRAAPRTRPRLSPSSYQLAVETLREQERIAGRRDGAQAERGAADGSGPARRAVFGESAADPA